MISLAIGAITLAVVGGIGKFVPLGFNVAITDFDSLTLHFYDGRVRLFWFRAIAPAVTSYEHRVRPSIRASQRGPTTDIHVSPDPPFPRGATGGQMGPNPPQVQWNARMRIGSQRDVPDFGFAWSSPFVVRFDPTKLDESWRPPMRLRALRVPEVVFSFFRLPVWLVVVAMLVPPVRAAIRHPIQRRRLRRHECVDCGYNLTGLPLPRCPECGLAFDAPTD